MGQIAERLPTIGQMDDDWVDACIRGLTHSAPVPIGKTPEFEAAHPRAKDGEFTTGTGDVKFEFEQAMKKADQYHFEDKKLNVLAAMLHRRKADALPTVESEVEIQNHAVRGEKELWRGVSDQKYGKEFRSGPLFIGCGTMGSGIYVALGKDARFLAKDYAYAGGGNGDLLHMTLRPEAKVGDWATVVKEMDDDARKLGARHLSTDFGKMFLDAGVYGAARGYDALLSPTLGMGIVLNRSVLRVSKENGLKSAVAKAVVAGNALLSRRVGAAMASDRLAYMVVTPDIYLKFVSAVMGAQTFSDLPNWCQEEVLEGEAELGK